MNILPKFKLNVFTYFLLLASLFSGFFKNIILILIIVIFHELGHIFFLKRYEYTIEKVEIFPFGGITSVKKPINTPLKQEIKIAFAGIFFQILLYGWFYFIYGQNWIYQNTFELFLIYNTTILIFNLLPIIPLDGSIILHSILEFFFPYKKAYAIYMVLSCLCLVLFFSVNYLWSLNNYMILSFLVFKTYHAFKERLLLHNKFLLERFLYSFPYQKIKSQNYPDLDSIKKDTLHFFWTGNKYLHEKDFLRKRFDNSLKL